MSWTIHLDRLMQLKISTLGLGAMIPPILIHQPQFYVIENYVHLIYFAKKVSESNVLYGMWQVGAMIPASFNKPCPV